MKVTAPAAAAAAAFEGSLPSHGCRVRTSDCAAFEVLLLPVEGDAPSSEVWWCGALIRRPSLPVSMPKEDRAPMAGIVVVLERAAACTGSCKSPLEPPEGSSLAAATGEEGGGDSVLRAAARTAGGGGGIGGQGDRVGEGG